MLAGAFAAILSGLLAGCSSYTPDKYEKNLTVRVHLDTWGIPILTPREVDVTFVAVDEKCKTKNLGGMGLKEGETRIGLAVGKPITLAVVITRHMGAEASKTLRAAMFIPEPGRQYEITVNYADKLFDFRLFEMTGAGKKQMPIASGSDCQISWGA